MKLSLSWIFDHIDADWRTISIPDLISKVTSSIAELEHVKHLSFDLHRFTLAKITTVDTASVQVRSAAWQTEHTLPLRPGVERDQWYLIHKEGDSVVRWATTADFGSSKEGLLPVFTPPTATMGSWADPVEVDDYIFEIDNKSINNRPDLWGHRGFAREIATLLGLNLKPEHLLCADVPVRSFDESVTGIPQSPVGITLKDTKHCSRFAGVYIDGITVPACDLQMALRLARVDSKPINLIVDVTNYVMLDVGQPMHAYDAHTIKSGIVTARLAEQGQKLELLDGQTITLTHDDLIIADGATPIGLAGIMGGAKTAITAGTTALFAESACFDATTIRHGAARHKLRTEASARFEKTLDPEQTTHALRRMIKLLHDKQVPMTVAPYIASLGLPVTAKTILVSHAFIETSLGICVAVEKVKAILERLGCGVSYKNDTYEVVIPSFRATKDIALKQDIVEEIGRFVGYQSITPVLPSRLTKPVDTYALMRMRTIRNYLAYSLHMHELANYAFFDEQFLRDLAWQPTSTVDVANPLSEQWYRLVTSLMPNMIRAVALNSADYDSLRFFESAKVWNNEGALQERAVLAGIMFEKKESVDFYRAQQELQSFFAVLGMPVTWHRVDAPDNPWFMPHQTADIMLEGQLIGCAGKINPSFLHRVTEGDAFIFELDAALIKHFKPAVHKYQPLSKYPDLVRDVSFFIPLRHTAHSLKALIQKVHAAIVAVDLVDAFQKPEWQDRKALTFRYVLRDMTKTYTKAEADDIGALIIQALEAQGAEIR